MIENFVKDIRELQRGLESESCKRRDPFVKLGSGGAPTLNYNIPQSAGFTMYGQQFVKGIKNFMFKSHASEIPRSRFDDMSEDEIFQMLVRTRPIQMDALTVDRSLLERVTTEREVGVAPEPVLRGNIVQAFSASVLQDVQAEQIAGNIVDVPAQVGGVQKETPLDPLRTPGTPVRPPDTPNDVVIKRIAGYIKAGYQPMLVEGFGGFKVDLVALSKPGLNPDTKADANNNKQAQPQPYFFILEEYTTKSYLGDYGAGRTIKTFSLLPGEKTTISVRTYKERTKEESRSENILDSFSESSAREMESMIEEETGSASNSATEKIDQEERSRSVSVSASVSGAFARIAGFGASAGYEANNTRTSTNTSSATRSSNARSLNKALEKHVAKSNASRSIDVNTSAKESVTEGEETSIVRELENTNKSRVLNFVFRQLLQQYVSITYLSNIKVVFSNGYVESLRVVNIEELDILLEDLIVQSRRNEVRQAILRNYLTVRNYKGESKEFVELVRNTTEACVELGIKNGETERFWSVKRDITDSWRADENSELEITVPGPILNVATHTLRTSSMVVDAMLGQGEALDSFGLRVQDAAATSDQLENVERLQQVGIVQGIEDPVQRAELYRKVFGNDCLCDNQNT